LGQVGVNHHIRLTIHGKQTGTMMGIPPSGKTVNVTATGIFRVVDGKATDNWVNFDALGLLQQIGAAPNKKNRVALFPCRLSGNPAAQIWW
jgi:hypothetical protein